jgi:hypothetical protein
VTDGEAYASRADGTWVHGTFSMGLGIVSSIGRAADGKGHVSKPLF